MKTIDIEQLCAILQEASNAEILPRFRRLSAADVREKSEAIDLVTAADEGAEEFIVRRAAELMPQAVVVGEEGISKNPSLLDGLAELECVILVDPIDGTANFAAGVPMFGVMAAVLRFGKVVAGIIYDPMGDDWVVAEKGTGAWLWHANGDKQRLTCLAPKSIEQMVGSNAAFMLPKARRPEILSRLAQVRMSVVFRNAAHTYRTFALGHFDYVMFYNLMPWDHAPGALIATEAGGYVARFDGQAYQPVIFDGGLLVASDVDSWHVLMERVFKL